MKISELLNDNGAGAYVLGTIFAFKYRDGNNYASVFLSRNQARTNHFINIKDFDDQFERIEKYYSIKIKDKYISIQTTDFGKKIFRAGIGYYSIIENDIKGDLDFPLFERISIDEKFAINFIRGILDSRSSVDTTASYLALDIRKKDALSFSTLLIKAFGMVFETRHYNINARFKSPEEISRKKNPQFRVPFTALFGTIGTFRTMFFEKLKLNKNEWAKFVHNTNIPESFNDLIIWDTSNIPYRPRGIEKTEMLRGDIDYFNNYTKAGEQILYTILLEKYPDSISSVKNKRKSIPTDEIDEVLAKYHSKDFLEPTYKIDTNKKGEPLLDVHHIVPHKFAHFFEERNDIDSSDNLVTLRQDTHYILHRGEFNDKKINYLHKLYDQVLPFLKRKNVDDKITFDVFKTMY